MQVYQTEPNLYLNLAARVQKVTNGQKKVGSGRGDSGTRGRGKGRRGEGTTRDGENTAPRVSTSPHPRVPSPRLRVSPSLRPQSASPGHLSPFSLFGYKLFTSMRTVSLILTALVALEHIGILVLEMFFWDHPFGQRIFGMTPEVSAASAVLAANQGLYNGFLAAGLLWGLFARRKDVIVFFLICVTIAGIFGGLTAKTSIAFTQMLPALLALVTTLTVKRG